MNRRVLGALAFAAVTALSVSTQAVAAPSGSNELVASGTVTENLGGAPNDWVISFEIHKKSVGNSTWVSITQGSGGPTSTFSGSVCSGTYTDPILGGTNYYAVGPVISGNMIYGTPYEVFVVHQGGPLGADYSWSVPASLPDLASAKAYCDNVVTTITPVFALTAADVFFRA